GYGAWIFESEWERGRIGVKEKLNAPEPTTSASNIGKDMERNLDHDLHSDSSTVGALSWNLNDMGSDIVMISKKASLNSINAGPLNGSNVPQHAGPSQAFKQALEQLDTSESELEELEELEVVKAISSYQTENSCV
nr:hypothetical protein [Tanacetum cinerariifolium]